MKTLTRFLTAVAILSAAELASAHAALVESTPKGGESVTSSPTELRLKFNEPLEAKFSSVKLVGPDGKELKLEPATAVTSDSTALSLPLPTLSSGQYTAQWSAMGKDGHRTKGVVMFTVK